MAVKKKSTKPEEERRPPVTQVVEVVEDGQEMVSAPNELEDSPMEEKSEHMEDSSDEQKRRVLVDELFQKKPEQSVRSAGAPEISIHHKASGRPIFMWAIIMIVVCLVAGGIILAVSSGKISLPSMVVVSTPTPTSTPSPTPTPDLTALDRATLSVQVLNGSGTPGVAGTMKDLLEEKGYTVDNTGNAEAYDYETTHIFVKAESEAYIALLEEDLKESYNLGTSEATLASDVLYDVRIIVGKSEI